MNGAAIDGGTITDNNTIDVTGASKIDSGATLNNGAVTVESDVTLTLDGMTVNGTTITDKGTIVLDDTVQADWRRHHRGRLEFGAGGDHQQRHAGSGRRGELLNDTVTNTSGILQVDDGQTLTLSGTEIIGGTINDFSHRRRQDRSRCQHDRRHSTSTRPQRRRHDGAARCRADAGYVKLNGITSRTPR